MSFQALLDLFLKNNHNSIYNFLQDNAPCCIFPWNFNQWSSRPKRGSHIRLGDLFWIIQFMTHLFPRFLILLHRCMHFIFLHSKFEKFLEDPPKNFYCKLAYLVPEIPISLKELGGSAPPNFCIFRYQFLPLSTKNVNNTFNRKFW